MLSSRVRRRFVSAAALALVIQIPLTACGAGSSDTDSAIVPSPGPVADTTYPYTIESEYGTTTIDTEPERVVALGDLDDALALGVIPVGSFRPAGDADELYDYEQAALEAARATSPVSQIEALFDPYADPDYEAIARLEPDVILASGYWDIGNTFTRLSEIAPVVTVAQGEDSTWQTRHRAVAQALNRGATGEDNIAAVDTAFYEASTANPQFADHTLSYAVVYPTQVTFMSVPDTEACWFFTRLGFQPPAGAGEFGEEYPADVVGEEQTPLLDADIVVIGYHSLLDADQRRAFEESPLFRELPAVRDGRYIALPEGHDSSIPQPGVLSSRDDLAAVLPLLQAATTA